MTHRLFTPLFTTLLALAAFPAVAGTGGAPPQEQPPPDIAAIAKLLGVPGASTTPEKANAAPESNLALGEVKVESLKQLESEEQAEHKEQKTASSQSVHVNSANRVELHVHELSVIEVLRLLSKESRRSIVTSAAVSGTVTADLYDVTFIEALSAVLRMSGLGFREDGDCLYVFTQEELSNRIESERRLETRIIKLRYLSALDARSLIESMKGPGGSIAVTPEPKTGIDSAASGSGSTGGNDMALSDTIVITDEPERLDRIVTALRELDRRPQQVLIEATILRATLTENNALGIDFTTLGGIDFAEVSSSSAAAQNIVTGQTPTAELENTTFTVRSDLNGAIAPGGLSFGIIKNQVGLFLRALETVADTTVIANPKVMALNKQRGEVIVGRRDGYRTTTTTETATVETINFLETGTQIVFRPYILDEDLVRMEIHPEDSTGGLTADGLPFEQTTEVTTNILVRNGHTILIGGLFRELDSAGRGQIPGLGNIPFAGALFRNTDDNTTREEVIILLTVRILDPAKDSPENKELQDDIERYRLGVRNGMQSIGRERLAQAHYRWALEHLAAGRTSRALWDAQLALHNNPQFIPAMKLIEQLQRRRMWDEETSTIRYHVQSLLARDMGVELPPFGRPAPPFKLPDDMGGAGGFDDGIDEYDGSDDAIQPVEPETGDE